MPVNQLLVRASVVAAAATTAVGLSAGVASAHIEVDTYGSQEPVKGGYAAITPACSKRPRHPAHQQGVRRYRPVYRIGDIETTLTPGWTSQVATKNLDQPEIDVAGKQ